MTPAQRLVLSARQSGEQIQRLVRWFKAGEATRPELASLLDEAEAAAEAISRILEAVEQPPAIAVVGPRSSGKTSLVAALSALPERPLRAEFGKREASLDVLTSILPGGSCSDAAVAFRLSSAEAPAAPRGFPVRLRLLGQLDIVKILFRAHAAHVVEPPERLPDAASIALAFADAERHLQARAVAGFSARDIVELREDVSGFDPSSPLLRQLAASGYWDRLALVVAHLPEAERTRLLSRLWNDDPVFSSLYVALAAAVERLGHSGDVYAELDAIVSREPGTGWLIPHRASVVAASTLMGLAHSLGPVPATTVQIAGRYGGATAIDRAALAAELPIRLAEPPLAGLEGTDLVTFPGQPRIKDFDWPTAPGDATAAAGSSASAGRLETAVTLFAHAKSIYLFERASRRHEIASVVVALDPAAPEDDALAGAVGDWIEMTQGAEPHQRERMRTSLFAVVARPAAAGRPAPRIEAAPNAGADPRLRRLIGGTIGIDQDWPVEWTPNRAFDNVFVLHRAHRPAASARPGDAALRVVDGPPLDAAAARAHIAPLEDALKAAGGRAVRDRQLALHLGEIRRRLRSRVMRHHRSNDPVEIAEWRRQVSNIAISRLRRPPSSARPHGVRPSSMAADLAVSEREMAAAIAEAWRVEAASGQSRTLSAGGEITAGRSLFGGSCHESAAAAVKYWLRSIRQRARSQRFCRHLGVPQAVMQHLIDELAIGTQRVGLVADIAAAFDRAGARAAGTDDRLVHLAAIAARMIGAFVARMPRSTFGVAEIGADEAGTRQVVSASARPTSVAVGTFGGSSGLAGAEAAGGGGASFVGDAWSNAYAGFVEANIAAAQGLVGIAERDRELGDLLAGFATSLFEVEL